MTKEKGRGAPEPKQKSQEEILSKQKMSYLGYMDARRPLLLALI